MTTATIDANEPSEVRPEALAASLAAYDAVMAGGVTDPDDAAIAAVLGQPETADPASEASAGKNYSASIAAFSDYEWAVPTRAALAALDPTVVRVAFLTESGREGDFVWTTGNFTNAVANDAGQGVYVQSAGTAASVGCWVRADTEVLRPEWFGAVSAPIGSALPPVSTLALDRLAAFVNWLGGSPGTPVRRQGVHIILRGAYYYTGEKLRFTHSALQISGTGWLTDGLIFSQNGLELDYDGDALHKNPELRRFAILTTNSSTSTQFTGLKLVGDNGGQPKTVFDQLLFAGKDRMETPPGDDTGWFVDIDIYDAKYVTINDCRIQGEVEHITESDGYFPSPTVGIRATRTTQCWVHRTVVTAKETGIKLISEQINDGITENMEVVNCLLFANRNGLDVEAAASAGDLNVIDTHFAFQKFGVSVSCDPIGQPVGAVTLSGCYFLKGNREDVAEASCLKFQGANGLITNNCFYASPAVVAEIDVVGIECVGGSHNLIALNTFYYITHPIYRRNITTTPPISANTTDVIALNICRDLPSMATKDVIKYDTPGVGVPQVGMNFGDRQDGWCGRLVGSQLELTPNVASVIAGPSKKLVTTLRSVGSTAVNYLELQNANTGVPVEVNARGSDADINLRMVVKGTGSFMLSNVRAYASTAAAASDATLASGSVYRINGALYWKP